MTSARGEPVGISARRESLASLKDAAAACERCHACPLFRHATQAVFGEGHARAEVMLVGEQPGDQEDLQGRPFVGPAGAVLDAVIAEAGLDRRRVYITNAVKHFKFEPRGKRRLHKKPNAAEVRSCKPWLVDELRLVRPRVVVALGATAALSLFGSAVHLTRDRGRPLDQSVLDLVLKDDASRPEALVTFHPSAVLRAPTSEMRKELRALLAADLALAERLSRQQARASRR
jgi:uracil-DNA glycosylase family protein